MFDLYFFELAQRSDRAPAIWRRPLIRWLDTADSGWAIPALLVGFVAIWTAYLSVAYGGSDLHPDTLEAWSVGRIFEWGNPKHPPLMGWIARIWTEVFPLTNWSMRLMAMVNAAVGLWAVDLIARRFVTGDKRIFVLLLLMLTPAYQFHAQRFNANSVLLSVWPIATYCFLRSFQTRAPLWSAAAGVTAALAMLGKYYSVFLLAAFVSAALFHRSRRVYLTSSAPWISSAAGLIALGPHLMWLAQSGAPTFDYASAHAGADRLTSLHDALNFILGLVAAMSVAAITWCLTAGRRLGRAASDFARMDDGLQLLWLVGVGAIVFPVLTCVLVGTDLPSLWALQGLFLFVVPVVASTSYPIERFYTVNALVLVALIALLALTVAAPVHAIYRNRHGYEEGRNFYHQAAHELTQQWRALVDAPLTAVSGDDALAFAVAFYSPDHPHYARPFAHQHTWRTPRKETLDRGWAALCFTDQAECLDWMKSTSAKASGPIQRTFELEASLLGVPGVKRGLVSLIVPPSDALLPDELSSANRRGPGL
jgi:4-amino-4-deoxy-L-arabinose transferase-like glycosyltransferase